MKKQNEKIAKCPFCGNDRYNALTYTMKLSNTEWVFSHTCNETRVNIHIYGSTEQEVVNLWNKRSR